MTSFRASVPICVGLSMAVALAQPVMAEESTARADSSPEGGQDIIVTSTLRETALARVPVAVSAISGEDARTGGVTDIRALNQLAPSLLVYSTGSDANAVARVRGVGTVGDNPGLESSVAIFIDGVYRSRTGAGLNELGEIHRIEVLRGPQGTLFGRNASAGLINVMTKAPEFSFGGHGEISTGNYDYWRLSGRVTGPISNHVAASIEGVVVKRNGFLDIVNASGAKTGDTNDRDRYMVRGQLLFRPTDDFSLRLIGDMTRRDESCCGAVYSNVGEETGSTPGNATSMATNRIITILQSMGAVFPNGPTPYSQNPNGRNISITPGRDYVSRVRDWGLSAEANYELPGGTRLTSITAWRDYYSADYGDYDYGTVDLAYRGAGTYREFKTVSQELRAHGSAFGGTLDWLVGGYYAHEDLALRDDLRFGRDYGRFGACRLMAGAANAPSALIALSPNCASATGLGALAASLAAGGVPAPYVTALRNGLSTLNGISDAGDVEGVFRQESDNFAIFTHNIIRVTSKIDLTLGLRYTHESKALSARFANDNVACGTLQNSLLPAIAGNSALGSAATLAGGILTLGCLGNSSASLNALDLHDRISEGHLSGTAIASWRPTDELMLYGSFSHGYKAGGYNLDRFELGNTGIGANVAPLTFFRPRSNADAASLRFGSEMVDAYEIGIKFGQRRWGVNLAAFRQEFGNFQLNTFNGTGFIVQNINGCKSALLATGICAASDVKAGLVSQGVEVELNLRPVPDLRVSGGVTYADVRFADRLVGSPDGATPLDPALFLLPGNQMFNAPDIVTTAGLTWTPAIGQSGLGALIHVDARLTGDTNAGSDLYPEKAEDGYVLLNARIGVNGGQGRWSLELWGQNLTNSHYAQVVFNSPAQSTGPANQSSAQLGQGGVTMTNQLFSGYLGEPRTYGATLRWRF